MTNDPSQDDLKDVSDEVDGVKLSDLDPASATPEQVAGAIKVAQSALVQRGKWKEKAIDPDTGKPYKDVVAELKANQKPPQQVTTPDATEPDDVTTLKTDVDNLKMVEEKRQFGHRHTLSPEETDQVFAYALGMKLDPAKALEQPFIKSALEAMRATSRTNSATPGPSSRSPVVDGKTPKDMSHDDRRKNWNSITRIR